MKPHYSDDWLTVYAGDCREVLKTLPDESVHCVVTSPPYWGLRDYGTATWEGGIEREVCPECAGAKETPESAARDEACPRCSGTGTVAHQHTISRTDADRKAVFSGRVNRGDRTACLVCGALRVDGQLGLEPTPEQYVENMVGVFREVRRVLRDDGTLWLNLGDTYMGGGGGNYGTGMSTAADHGQHLTNVRNRRGFIETTGLKPKDLVGIPWRVAFALQADGWYLRSDIIWAKPNPMPESVTDRPTKSHEYLFLLAKSQRYYFDQEAVAEPLTESSIERLSQDVAQQEGSWRVPGKTNGAMKAVGGPSWQERKEAGAHPGSHGVGSLVGNGTQRGVHGAGLSHDLHTKPTRNIRSVWMIATQPYPGAHFAVFPPKLVEPCLKAGCPSGGVVLDPFAGSGTVGMVAQSLSRRAVLIDLNPAYIEQQMKRNADVPLGLSA